VERVGESAGVRDRCDGEVAALQHIHGAAGHHDDGTPLNVDDVLPLICRRQPEPAIGHHVFGFGAAAEDRVRHAGQPRPDHCVRPRQFLFAIHRRLPAMPSLPSLIMRTGQRSGM
jgi:hypothetical protein